MKANKRLWWQQHPFNNITDGRLTTKTHNVEVFSSVENLVSNLLKEHGDTLTAYRVVLLPVSGHLLRNMLQADVYL